MGLIGVIRYVTNPSRYGGGKVKWLGLAAVLVVFWVVGTVGQQQLDSWYPWAGFFAGLFVLYVKFGNPIHRSHCRSI